ncbi:MAG: CRISPR-associated protein Csx11 [Euryarchaeota archaeon]|nr:CRISPR-associated protein Csx11 [Euryarchaeota archaeon]
MEKLTDLRDALLLAEVAAWLHMFGKFHEDFLKGDHDLATQIPQDVQDNYPSLCDLLTDNWTGEIWNQLNIAELNGSQLSIQNLIKEHSNPNASNGLELLIWDAHGRGSSVEKGLLNRFALGQQNIVHSSTAFGFEGDSIDLQEVGNKRTALYGYLQIELDKLKNTSAHPSEGWQCFRDAFVPTVSNIFSLTVADTRRPLNDVTLFDQTVASVALFKAALAQIVLKGWKEPNARNVADKYHWRILRIGFNSPAFWSKSLKISDIDARKQLIASLLDEIRHLIETDYPMGYEIYRDEKGSVFVVPDVDDLLNITMDKGNTLSEVISELCRTHIGIEADVHLFPVTPKTRNILSFGQLASKTVPEPSPNPAWFDDIQTLWSRSNEICSVCGLRPQGPTKKAISRNVCTVCEERRVDRAKAWAMKLNHTIWIDEVADTKGRIAFIIGVLDLEDWLKGTVLNTIVAFDPQSRSLFDKERNGKQYQFDYSKLCQEIQQGLQTPNQTLGGNTLVDNLILKSSRGGFTKFGDIHNLYVSDSDLINSQREDWRFALTMIRQQPSFARIRRVWETTRQFWQDILPTDEEAEISESVCGRVFDRDEPEPRRLEISGDMNQKENPGPYHAYTLSLGKTKLSVVWDPENKRFITAHNLKYLAEPTQLGEDVEGWLESHKGQKIKIEEPTGYGSHNKEWGTITIDKVGVIPDSTYTPAIPILAEPRTFMALVPADKAPNVVSKINEKYEREMGKVRNRLPLHLGVVFAPYKTPLRTIMDAGRRMLKQTASVDGWEVEKKECLTADAGSLPVALCNDPHFAEYVSLKLARDGRSAVWHVPLMMGDSSTPDCWYPYVFVEPENDGEPPTGRKRMFEAPCPWNRDGEGNPLPTWLVHADDLQEGDMVCFTPATVDFQWLDTSGRRFEIAYGDKGRRLSIPQRPYLSNEFENLHTIWGTLSDHLTSTQIHALREMIEAKREEWGISEESGDESKTFWQFCRDAIANLEWKKCNGKYPWERDGKTSKTGWLNTWADYAVHGWLDDAIELHMQIMKEKPKYEKERLP